MSFIRGGETITIKRRSATSTDAYGNNTYALTTITVKDALVAIGGTSEPIDVNRDAVDSQLTVYLPNGTEVQDGDIFVIRNSQWQKAGAGLEWVSPFASFEAGVVVPLRKRNG